MDPMDHDDGARPPAGQGMAPPPPRFAAAGVAPPPPPPPNPTSSSSSLPTLLPVRRPLGASAASADDTDAGVRATNDDAQVSKLSAVSRGYFEDPFVELFVRRPQRRSPLINRGYWARHAVMRRLILAFLRHYAPAAAEGQQQQRQQEASAPPLPPTFEPTCQVVVLGAGYDTTWLQLCREHDAYVAAGGGTAATTTTAPPTATPAPDPGAGGGARPGRDVADPRARVRWVEVDFPEVVASKARVLLSGASGRQQQHQAPPVAAATAAAAAPSLLFPPRLHATATNNAAAAEQAASLVRAQLPTPADTSVQSTRPPPEILGRAYASVGCDLRSPERGLGPALVRAGAAAAVSESDDNNTGTISLRLPTLFVAECVLAYLEPGEARALLEFLGRCAAGGGGGGDGGGSAKNTTTSQGVPAAVLAYDVLSPDDPFGRQMQANLAARGCPMRGAAAAPDPPAQAARLRGALSLPSSSSPSNAAVSVEADALDMSDVWSRMLAVDLEARRGTKRVGGGGAGAAEEAAAAAPPSPFPRRPPPLQPNERRRAERIEPLDELEEWELFGKHYCVALGVREPSDGGGQAPPPSLWAALRAALRPAAAAEEEERGA